MTATSLSLAGSLHAGGTLQDYERSNGLEERAKGKVARLSVEPNWIGGGPRFWYRNDLTDERCEFIVVDPSKPSRRMAFDHARLAEALSKALDKPVEADRLPVDALAFVAHEPILRLRVEEKTFDLHLETYALKESDESLNAVEPVHPDDLPPSRNGGGETYLTFSNRTGEEVTLFWMDTEGQRRSYGTLSAGQTKRQHTFTGHVWLIADRGGRPLAAFAAADFPALAVIDREPPRRKSGFKASENPALSPDGKWRIEYRDYNVFLKDVATGEERALATDGSAEDRYEGRPHWSPDSKKVVVFQTVPAQERPVPLIESSPEDQLQPKLHTFDYLKPGDRIAHPRPRLFHVETWKSVPIREDLFPTPWEISNVRWEPDSERFTFLYNQRGHQVMRLIAVDADTGAASALIDETAKTFIDWTGKTFLHRIEKTGEAIWMSERDGWNHLYLYDTRTGRLNNPITKGEWVVRGVERVDEEKRQVWFRAGGIRPGQDPYYVHLCRVNFDGSGLSVLTEGDGAHRVFFSPDREFFVDTYSRVDLPPVTELRRSRDGKKLLELERGDDSALRAAGLPRPERFTAKGRDGKTDIYGVIFRPSTLDTAKKYPVVEQIYAGPQSAHVPKAYAPVPTAQRLAELGFIVVQIDGMGTSHRSKAFHDVAWKNLADAGFPDRIPWIKAAAEKYPYMDLSRVGIYGTSAGGQSALGALLLHGDFYKAAVADSGCHDNRMDKIWWNEQWMGWPVGPHYEEQSNVTLAHRLEGKLLLMVGELDRNVDPASTMQVVNALIRADKDFELLVVPGGGHGITGTLYGRRRLQDFFVRHLLGVDPPHDNASLKGKAGEDGKDGENERGRG
ncbi:MAG: prolyl oligopeptidase family serine peptidase [Armatimonadetes bacterium]|nr:prolyl oligopeptidase family serine peptidase [Armatimonadota bacterium]